MRFEDEMRWHLDIGVFDRFDQLALRYSFVCGVDFPENIHSLLVRLLCGGHWDEV